MRNICISIGASIGIMSVILMLSLGNGVKSYFNNTMNSYVNPLVIEVNMPSNEDETIDLDITTNVMYINTSSNKYTDAIKEKVKELGYTESSQDQMSAMFNEMINILTYVLAGIAAISLVVSTIMIIVVMYISVVERTKEIGIIKAIGAREKDIRRIFVCEAFLIGVFSGILGLSFSFLLMKGINIISTKMFDINLVLINNSYIVFGVGSSIIISTVAGLLPANKAAKLDPVESLRRE